MTVQDILKNSRYKFANNIQDNIDILLTLDEENSSKKFESYIKDFKNLLIDYDAIIEKLSAQL